MKLQLKRAEQCRELIETMIKQEATKTAIASALKIQKATLESYLKILDIKYKGQQNRKGQKKGKNDYKPASYYIENNIPVSGYFLLNRLLRENIKEFKCESCGATEWLGSKENLVLELHHIDGDHYNNDLSNLMVLCSNCHSAITRKMRKENKIDIQKKCKICGRDISKNATYCKSCAKNLRDSIRTNLPDRSILKNLIRELPFNQIALKFEVSTSCIRFWCKKYGLPHLKSDILTYSNSEWDAL